MKRERVFSMLAGASPIMWNVGNPRSARQAAKPVAP